MIRRLWHIFLVLMVASLSSTAKAICSNSPCVIKIISVNFTVPVYPDVVDTIKVKKEPEDKKKIKEIPTARRQAKPEKLGLNPVDTLSSKTKVKPPRQRRPDGLVRPPEIPRRNNN